MLKFCFASLVFLAIPCLQVFAQQPEFFFSFDGLTDGPISNSNPTGNFGPNASGSIFIYYDGTKDLEGAYLEVTAQTPGVIEFQPSSESLNFPAFGNGGAIVDRWDRFGPAATSGDSTIVGAFAFLDAIRPAFPDFGTVMTTTSTNAFQFARLDFTVVGSGWTDLSISVSEGVDDLTFQAEADINGDGFVDLGDNRGFVDIQLNNTLMGNGLLGDVNGDGFVNFGDIPNFFQILEDNARGIDPEHQFSFGTASIQTVPEPNSAVIICMSMFLPLDHDQWDRSRNTKVPRQEGDHQFRANRFDG